MVCAVVESVRVVVRRVMDNFAALGCLAQMEFNSNYQNLFNSNGFVRERNSPNPLEQIIKSIQL